MDQGGSKLSEEAKPSVWVMHRTKGGLPSTNQLGNSRLDAREAEPILGSGPKIAARDPTLPILERTAGAHRSVILQGGCVAASVLERDHRSRYSTELSN